MLANSHGQHAPSHRPVCDPGSCPAHVGACGNRWFGPNLHVSGPLTAAVYAPSPAGLHSSPVQHLPAWARAGASPFLSTLHPEQQPKSTEVAVHLQIPLRVRSFFFFFFDCDTGRVPLIPVVLPLRTGSAQDMRVAWPACRHITACVDPVSASSQPRQHNVHQMLTGTGLDPGVTGLGLMSGNQQPMSSAVGGELFVGHTLIREQTLHTLAHNDAATAHLLGCPSGVSTPTPLHTGMQDRHPVQFRWEFDIKAQCSAYAAVLPWRSCLGFGCCFNV